MKLGWLFCLLTAFLSAHTFDEMMGCETARWSYVKSARHQKQLSAFEQAYWEREPFLGEQSESYRIPPLIHVIWLGPKNFPLASVENIQSWRAHHPEWKIIFWTDRERPPPIRGMEMRLVSDFSFRILGQRYNQTDNWCEKSDILRYEILAQMGGLYLDHDAFCTANITHLHKNLEFYCCLEVPHYPIEGEIFTVGIGVLGCVPDHPLMWNVIDLLDQRWDIVTRRFNTLDRLTSFERVMHRTYAPMTLSVRDHFSELGPRDMVFPAAYFYPQESMEPIYSLHKYGSSWNMYGEQTPAKFTHQKIKKPAKSQNRLFVAMLGLVTTSGSIICVTCFYVFSSWRARARKKR